MEHPDGVERRGQVRSPTLLVLAGLALGCGHAPPSPITDAEPVARKPPSQLTPVGVSPPATVVVNEAAPALEPALQPEPEPVPKPSLPPVVLDQALALPGYAVARARLTTDQVVQINSGCGEWATYTEGVILEPEGQLLARFVGGPFVEVPGFLIVEQHVQIGSDGTGEPPTNPTPAQAVISGTNGAIWVTRVVAIDLATGDLDDTPGWDSFGAMPVDDEQGLATTLIVLGRGQTPVEYAETRDAASLHLWDVAAGTMRELAQPGGPFEVVVLDERAFVSHGDEALEVSHHGKVRAIDPALVPGDSPKRLEARSWAAGDPAPAIWASADGHPIEVPDGAGTRSPAVGYCGLDQALRLGDFVLVDDGLYTWPNELSWPPSDGR